MTSSETLLQLLNPELLEAEYCRRHYYEFFKKGFSVLEPTTPYVDNWHVKYLCDVLQSEVERVARREPSNYDYIVINIPPRSLKSSIVTVQLNAWAWATYPHLKFITASYSGDLALEHSVATRTLMQSSWYQEYYGKAFEFKEDQNVKSRFNNNHTGSRRATSVGGTVTGGGADIVCIDDPLSVLQGSSELERKKANDWVQKTMFTRLNDQLSGLRVVVMQRLHEEDVTGMILNSGLRVLHINIPAQLPPDDVEQTVKPEELVDYYDDEGLFFPVRFSAKVLRTQKLSLGSVEFAGQFDQSPSPAEGSELKRDWFGMFVPADLPEGIVRNFYSDTAYGKLGSDNSATLCYSVFEDNLYIWNSWTVRVPFPEFLRKYVAHVVEHGYDSRSLALFEPKASGSDIVQALKEVNIPELGRLNVKEAQAPVDSKVTSVKAISAIVEAGRVKLLRGGHWVESFLTECAVFPNGKNDDQVDTLVGAIKHDLSGNSFYFSAG